MNPVVAELVALASVPFLLVPAWRGWARIRRQELPAWRSGLSLSALFLLSLHWVGAAVLEAPAFVVPQAQRPPAFNEAMLTLSHPLDVAIVVLALALRGLPRSLTLLAALLMLISLPVGYS